MSRGHQLTEVDTNDEPVRVDMSLDCPKAAATYYSTCGKIDQHNRCRQDTLNLEKKIQTNQWDRRVNMSIFGMIVVDSWMLYKGCTGGNQLHQTGYYKALMDALIDSPLKTVPETRQQAKASESTVASLWTKIGTSGRGLHLTPTKRKKPATETQSARRRQSRCRNCNAKTVMVCSYCRDDPDIGESGAAYCCPTTDRNCYERHMIQFHS